MSKTRPPVILTTTSDHLSRAAEAILKRFPEAHRPGKNAILNDIAAALQPGKNWGGLLAAPRAGLRSAPPGASAETPRTLQALKAAVRLDADKTVIIGAVERRLRDAGGVIDTCFIRSPESGDALDEAIDGGTLIGVVVDIMEEMSGYAVLPIPSLLIVKNGALIKVDYNRVDVPPAAAQLIFLIIQEVWFTDWSDLLRAEGISLGQVIVGPVRGAAIITRETRDAINLGQNIHHHEVGAVRFAMPDDMEAATDLAIFSRLAEMTLAIGMTAPTASYPKIEIAGLREKRGTWSPAEGYPAEWPDEDFLVRPPGGNWLPGSDDPTMAGNSLSHLLGEALAFAMDFHGVSYQEGLFIEATGRDISPGDRKRLFADDWKIVAWRGDQAGIWRLDDAAEDALFRRRIEAWLKSEKAEFQPRSWIPDDATTVLAFRSMHRNTRHWERAVDLFREIS